MKFSRIDEETVRCVLSEEDMKEQGIEIEDFFKNKDKIQKFLEGIVEQAREEVGYESDSGVLAMQVMPLPENGLAIIFSENPENNFREMFKSLKDVVGEIASEITDTLAKKEEGAKAGIRIHRFASLSRIEEFCYAVPMDKRIKSQVYKDEAQKTYYLVMEKGRTAAKLFNLVNERAFEFGEYVSDQPIQLTYIQEHYTCLIKKNAISILQRI